VELLAPSIDNKPRTGKRTDEGPSIGAQVGEEVLALDAPIVEEGVFDTCAYRIADSCVATSVGGEEVQPAGGSADEGVAEVSAGAEGYTACAVEEEAVKGDTAAAADSTKEASVVAGILEAGEGAIPAARYVAVAFDAEDELVDLPIDTSLAAWSAWTRSTRRCGKYQRICTGPI
jgi:hypothetical protein